MKVSLFYLLTGSEVIIGKSQTEALIYWTSDSKVNASRPRSEIFLQMTEQMMLISYLFCGLSIMDLSLQSIIKTNNWSANNFKKTYHLNELYFWAHETVR